MVYDPLAALRALVDHGVRFVVTGGFAGRLWGSPTMTNDLDICYARDHVNVARLTAALHLLDARLRGPGVDDDLPFLLEATTLEAGQNLTFSTAAGGLDVLGMPAGVRGYDDLAVNAAEFDLGDGLIVPVCHIDDLIRMKRAAGRPKDRIELEVLTAVREELDGPPSSVI